MAYRIEMDPGRQGPEPVVAESARKALSQYLARSMRFGPQVIRDDDGQEVMVAELHRVADGQDNERRYARRRKRP